MNENKCRLCLQEKELIQKSHILSEFLYEQIYDKKHRFLELNYNPHSKQVNNNFKQKGNYEGKLLCKECDGVIMGQEEKYAKEKLYYIIKKDLPSMQKKYPEGKSVEINLNLQRIKRFILFNLFRMSISNLEFYRYVDLGPKEEELRNQLYNDYIFKQNEYPIFISACTTKMIDGPDKLIPMPRIIRQKDGYKCYFFIFGVFHIIQISKHLKDEDLMEKWDYENSVLRFSYLPDKYFFPILNSMANLPIY